MTGPITAASRRVIETPFTEDVHPSRFSKGVEFVDENNAGCMFNRLGE
jgi:hypothetical protein